MFVRKGTTLRKKHQSVRRPRRTSLPPQTTGASSDAEAGNASPVPAPGPSTTSSTSSTLTLDDEKNLVHHHHQHLQHHQHHQHLQHHQHHHPHLPPHSENYLTKDSYQPVNYGSILFQLREAHVESVDLCDFIQRSLEILWQSLVLTVFLLLLLGLPISMLAMGTSYLKDCPKEPKIPIYLLVGGAFGFIHILIILWQQKRSRDYMLLDDFRDDDDNDEDDVMTRSYRFTGYVLSMFLLIWFAMGNYWLFSIWEPNYKQPLHDPGNWCSKELYSYAFYQLIVCYALLGVSCLVFLGCLVAYLFVIRGK